MTLTDTRTTGNDAQFIPIYTKLDEMLRHNTSCNGCTLSRTHTIVSFTSARVPLQSANTSWRLSSVVVDLQLFRVLSDTSWSAGVSIESMAKGCPPPDTCSRATVYRDQMGGREIVGQSSKQKAYAVGLLHS